MITSQLDAMLHKCCNTLLNDKIFVYLLYSNSTRFLQYYVEIILPYVYILTINRSINTFLLFTCFRMARCNFYLSLIINLANHHRCLQKKIYPFNCGFGRLDNVLRLPFYIVCQPISPAIHKLWSNDR